MMKQVESLNKSALQYISLLLSTGNSARLRIEWIEYIMTTKVEPICLAFAAAHLLVLLPTLQNAFYQKVFYLCLTDCNVYNTSELLRTPMSLASVQLMFGML